MQSRKYIETLIHQVSSTDSSSIHKKTSIIDLQGNVTISSQNGKKLETEQLYFDQKNEYLIDNLKKFN